MESSKKFLQCVLHSVLPAYCLHCLQQIGKKGNPRSLSRRTDELHEALHGHLHFFSKIIVDGKFGMGIMI